MWTTEQIADRLRRSGRMLKLTSVFTVLSWFVLTTLVESAELAFLWTALTGAMIFLGGHRLGKCRDPGTVPLIVAMLPATPAVVFGLPASLYELRMLGRQDVQTFLKQKAGEKLGDRIAA